MGQNASFLTACDGRPAGQRDRTIMESDIVGCPEPQGIGMPIPREEDPMVGCAALEEGFRHAVGNANRGVAKISDHVLVNHELLQAARQGNLKVLSSALEKGAWTETRRPLIIKPQKPDMSGRRKDAGLEQEVGMTAIMFSAQNGSVECVKRLIWAGAQVNAVDEDGWAPLHFASKEGYLEVCSALLKARADVARTNIDDKSALQLAEAEDPGFAQQLKTVIADLANE